MVAGPRPVEVQIRARVMYNIHQRLAPTMRKGNVLLVGDAAHTNNPMGALGLNTGMLDSEALTDALIMVLRDGYSPAILDVYSDQRRQVFQNFVDPTSTHNKLRIQTNTAQTAAQDDWYLRAMANPTHEVIQELSRPYIEYWRTDMRTLCGKKGYKGRSC